MKHGIQASRGISPLSMMRVIVALLAVVTVTLAAAVPTCTLKPGEADPATASGLSNSTSSSNKSGGGSSRTSNHHDGPAGMDDEVIATAWYPGWLSATFPPSAIPWSKYNMMTYAFALTSEDSSKLDLNGEEQVLKTFVAEAQKNGVKALLSIGGWTGSQHFSTAVATDSGRASFLKAITNVVTEYKLDGIDFDWEYPNQDGIGCNTKSAQDTPNFLAFLKQLKDDPVGSKLILTAAVSTKTFTGPDGEPVKDVSEFASVLDYVAIMNYDVFGSWSTTTGPNAPLKDSCASANARFGSAESAVAAWTGAQFPAEKLLLGVAAYGHSFYVENSGAKTSGGNLNVFAAFEKSRQPLGQGESAGTESVDRCGNPEGPSGVFYFNGLIDAGFLDSEGNPGDGIDYTFDECSQTPFVYKQSAQTLVSFDDARSFAAKGEFINSKSLKGFAVWHVAGDSQDNILLNSMHKAIGITSVCEEGDETPEGSGENEGSGNSGTGNTDDGGDNKDGEGDHNGGDSGDSGDSEGGADGSGNKDGQGGKNEGDSGDSGDSKGGADGSDNKDGQGGKNGGDSGDSGGSKGGADGSDNKDGQGGNSGGDSGHSGHSEGGADGGDGAQGDGGGSGNGY